MREHVNLRLRLILEDVALDKAFKLWQQTTNLDPLLAELERLHPANFLAQAETFLKKLGRPVHHANGGIAFKAPCGYKPPKLYSGDHTTCSGDQEWLLIPQQGGEYHHPYFRLSHAPHTDNETWSIFNLEQFIYMNDIGLYEGLAEGRTKDLTPIESKLLSDIQAIVKDEQQWTPHRLTGFQGMIGSLANRGYVLHTTPKASNRTRLGVVTSRRLHSGGGPQLTVGLYRVPDGLQITLIWSNRRPLPDWASTYAVYILNNTVQESNSAKVVVSKGYDGNYALVTNKGKPVHLNDTVRDSDGNRYVVIGGAAPHKDTSSGRVEVRPHSSHLYDPTSKHIKPDSGLLDIRPTQYYPSVFNLEWLHERDWKAKRESL